MNDNEKNDWDIVKRKVAAILSISEPEAAALIREGHREEVPQFAEHFRTVAGILGNQWLGRLQAGLSPQRWQVSQEGERHVAASGDESLRFLTQEFFVADSGIGDDEAAVGKKNLEGRALLYTGLDAPSGPYHEMTRWLAPPAFQLETNLPLNGDCAFSEVLLWLEGALNTRLQALSGMCRPRYLDLSTPTPPHVIQECSREALEELKARVDAWCKDSSLAGELPNSLRARVSANIAVNRALLEWCAKDRFGRDAARLSTTFLQSLNSCGIDKVPEEVGNWYGMEMADLALAALLERWFGYDGQFSGGPPFAQRLDAQKIKAVVKWSLKLQMYYIGGRGGGREMNAEEVHGQPLNLFVFGLAVLSTFFVKGHWDGKAAFELIQTPKELPAPKKRSINTYSVSGSIVDEVLSAHAAEIIAQVYSQMYFGNTSDYLRAEDVRAYASTQSVKRAHQEQLLAHAVKGRSSQELMNLFTHVHPFVQERRKRAVAGR